MYNRSMKVGDTVRSCGIIGRIIRFQQKTGDVIVKDKEGKLHVFLQTKSEVVYDQSKNR